MRVGCLRHTNAPRTGGSNCGQPKGKNNDKGFKELLSKCYRLWYLEGVEGKGE